MFGTTRTRLSLVPVLTTNRYISKEKEGMPVVAYPLFLSVISVISFLSVISVLSALSVISFLSVISVISV